MERKLNRTKTSVAVVDYLLGEILDGRLGPGDRLDLDRVAEELGVSRSPVREAALALERDGILRMPHHRGVFVENLDAESVLDEFEIIGLLSGMAVARLAERRDPHVLSELEDLLDELRSVQKHQPDRVGEIFHELLRTQHRAGGSHRLRAVLRSFTNPAWVMRVTYDRPEALRVHVRAHVQVVRAIAAGDAERAARLRLEDFRAAGRTAVEVLNERGVL